MDYANLATAYSQASKKVLVLDADLRKCRQHKLFNRYNKNVFLNFLQSMIGLENNIEIKNETLEKAIFTTGIANLGLITAGVIPPNPAELLETDGVNYLIEEVKKYLML